MSILPPIYSKHCFVACPDYKVKAGQCSCVNNINNNNSEFITQLMDTYKATMRDDKINTIIEDDKSNED